MCNRNIYNLGGLNMRNLFQHLATGFVLIILICSVTSCDRQSSFNIFNQKVETSSTPQFSGHDKRFLEVTGLNDLDYVIVDKLSMGIMTKISNILLPSKEALLDISEIAFVYIYTENSNDQGISISKSNTHAFSIVGLSQKGPKHNYYEKQSDNSFRQLLSLPRKLNGPLNMDEIRMLHFAAVKGSKLPEKSSIYEFRSELFNNMKLGSAPNKLLMKSLLLDLTRNKGSKTIGLYGDALYSALRADDRPGTGSCGNAQLCPSGGNGSCVPSPVAGYMCQTGDGGGGDGCTAAQLPVLSKVMGFNLTAPIDFRAIHSFRDDFLSKSDVGKKYVGYMYVFSQFAKMDIKSLTEYASITLPLQTSINTIMSDGRIGVVISEDLKQQAKTIINNHKDIADTDFQKILARLELDLDRLSGLNKNDFIREFEGMPITVK